MIFGMGDTALASVLAAAIAGLVAWLTAKSNKKAQVAAATAAANAAVANQTLSSRTEIEKDAFERAKSYYTDALDRQRAELTEVEANEALLKTRVLVLEAERGVDRHRIEELEVRVRHLEAAGFEDNTKIADLQEKLAVATRLLGEKYPDE